MKESSPESAKEPLPNSAVKSQEGSASVEDSILEIRQEVYLMGANDSEMVQFNEILGKLRSGEYSSEQALKEAHALKNQKQDYH